MSGAKMKIDARWVSTGTADCTGLQLVTFRSEREGFRFGGAVISDRSEHPFGLTFGLEVDGSWNVTRSAISLGNGRSLVLRSDGKGHWTDCHGVSLPELNGCIDIDISATPLTNTLPIRRLGLSAGERFDVVLSVS
jgi:hypothetical protein